MGAARFIEWVHNWLIPEYKEQLTTLRPGFIVIMKALGFSESRQAGEEKHSWIVKGRSW